MSKLTNGLHFIYGNFDNSPLLVNKSDDGLSIWTSSSAKLTPMPTKKGIYYAVSFGGFRRVHIFKEEELVFAAESGLRPVPISVKNSDKYPYGYLISESGDVEHICRDKATDLKLPGASSETSFKFIPMDDGGFAIRAGGLVGSERMAGTVSANPYSHMGSVHTQAV